MQVHFTSLDRVLLQLAHIIMMIVVVMHILTWQWNQLKTQLIHNRAGAGWSVYLHFVVRYKMLSTADKNTRLDMVAPPVNTGSTSSKLHFMRIDSSHCYSGPYWLRKKCRGFFGKKKLLEQVVGVSGVDIAVVCWCQVKTLKTRQTRLKTASDWSGVVDTGPGDAEQISHCWPVLTWDTDNEWSWPSAVWPCLGSLHLLS